MGLSAFISDWVVFSDRTEFGGMGGRLRPDGGGREEMGLVVVRWSRIGGVQLSCRNQRDKGGMEELARARMQPRELKREGAYLTGVLPAALLAAVAFCPTLAGRLRGVAKGVYFLKAVATNNILIPSVPLHDPEINTQAYPEACFACSALVSFFNHQIAIKIHIFVMDRRGYESPMDFEYQNRPPVDPSSPFAKTTPFAKSAHQSSSKFLKMIPAARNHVR